MFPQVVPCRDEVIRSAFSFFIIQLCCYTEITLRNRKCPTVWGQDYKLNRELVPFHQDILSLDMILQQHQHCVNLLEENLFSDNQNRVLLLHGSLYVFALMLRFSFEVIHLRKPTSNGLSNEFRNYFLTPDQLIHLRSWSFTSMTHSACQIIKLLYKF